MCLPGVSLTEKLAKQVSALLRHIHSAVVDNAGLDASLAEGAPLGTADLVGDSVRQGRLAIKEVCEPNQLVPSRLTQNNLFIGFRLARTLPTVNSDEQRPNGDANNEGE